MWKELFFFFQYFKFLSSRSFSSLSDCLKYFARWSLWYRMHDWVLDCFWNSRSVGAIASRNTVMLVCRGGGSGLQRSGHIFPPDFSRIGLLYPWTYAVFRSLSIRAMLQSSSRSCMLTGRCRSICSTCVKMLTSWIQGKKIKSGIVVTSLRL